MDGNRHFADILRRWYPQTVWVGTALQCVQALSEPWDLVVVDHELSGNWIPELGSRDNGLTAVMHIVKNQPTHLRSTHFIIRTGDADKGKIIVDVLRKVRYNAE